MSAREGWRRPTAPHPDRPDTWPVIWRVVAPRAGSYNSDFVVWEDQDEGVARRIYGQRRREGWAVRLERVCCGPLPKEAEAFLKELRTQTPQNPGAEMPAVLGYWERQ